MKYPLKIILSR